MLVLKQLNRFIVSNCYKNDIKCIAIILYGCVRWVTLYSQSWYKKVLFVCSSINNNMHQYLVLGVRGHALFSRYAKANNISPCHFKCFSCICSTIQMAYMVLLPFFQNLNCISSISISSHNFCSNIFSKSCVIFKTAWFPWYQPHTHVRSSIVCTLVQFHSSPILLAPSILACQSHASFIQSSDEVERLRVSLLRQLHWRL